jgi:hypothetical protein
VQGIRYSAVIIIEEVKMNRTRMDMKRKRIFKFLSLLLLMAGALFVASCSDDDDSVNTLTVASDYGYMNYMGGSPRHILSKRMVTESGYQDS